MHSLQGPEQGGVVEERRWCPRSSGISETGGGGDEPPQAECIGHVVVRNMGNTAKMDEA